MKNNKGVTLVEIIVSVVLISIVVIFIFNLMITVKNLNDTSNTSSTNIINKGIIIKKIEADFQNLGLVAVNKCIGTETAGVMVQNYNKDAYYCLKFTYNQTDSNYKYGYLVYYSYYNTTSKKDLNIIGYIRGNNITLRETNIPPIKNDNYNLEIKNSCAYDTYNQCALWISMPVVEDFDSSYNINLSYVYQGNITIGEGLQQ